jgi:hypothetical protein
LWVTRQTATVVNPAIACCGEFWDMNPLFVMRKQIADRGHRVPGKTSW